MDEPGYVTRLCSWTFVGTFDFPGNLSHIRGIKFFLYNLTLLDVSMKLSISNQRVVPIYNVKLKDFFFRL